MRDTPLCDLVLLSWNHLEETRPCLETLFAATQIPARLFIVDNGSAPKVREWLASVKPRGAIQEVVLLQNETNEGFSRGMNRGLQASTAPFVCLLNNDLRFTTGWLKELLAVAKSHPSIGLVNPQSSTFGSRPPRGQSLEAYAERLRRRSCACTEVGMCIGFCLLIKREVLDRVGALSEEVERAFFEDEDFSMRAQAAGYRCVVAEAAYVYHAEHRSVRWLPEREALFARNRQWCHQRWGRWVRVAWPRFAPVAPGTEELRLWLERLVGWARRRVYVYVFCPTSGGLTKEQLFESVGMMPHADVRWHPLPAVLTRWVAAGHFLRRRKKLLDVIVAPEPRWGRLVGRLRRLHRAEVIPEADEAALRRAWERSRASLTLQRRAV